MPRPGPTVACAPALAVFRLVSPFSPPEQARIVSARQAAARPLWLAFAVSARETRSFGSSSPYMRLSKNLAEWSTDRAAGELEGARPASNTIARRSEKPCFSRLFGNSILCSAKMLGGKAQSNKVLPKDFFDKLRQSPGSMIPGTVCSVIWKVARCPAGEPVPPCSPLRSGGACSPLGQVPVRRGAVLRAAASGPSCAISPGRP